jgi:hypothetical protein
MNAAVIEAINNTLDRHSMPPGLLQEVTADLRAVRA